MSKQGVKETLAIAALNRLLTLTHLVKEPILIGKVIFQISNYEYHLYLTEVGIERHRIKPTEFLLKPAPFSEIVETYNLTHTKLDQIYKELHEQTGS